MRLLRLTWARPNTFQLGFKCVSGTWLPVWGGSRVRTSSGPVDYRSPAWVLTERPLTPICETAVNCKIVKQAKLRTKFVIFVIVIIFQGKYGCN